MKIGVDACCWSNRRGFGRFTRELLTALVAEGGHEYVFFADRETAEAATFPAGVEVVTAATTVSPTEAASAEGRRSLADLWALTRTVARHDLDLFFFPAVYSYFPLLNRTRVVVTLHDVIADHHPEAFKEVFSESPAVHRFVNKMADGTQTVARILADEYGGDAANMWNDGADLTTVEKRVKKLPGFGPMKATKLKYCLYYFQDTDLASGA